MSNYETILVDRKENIVRITLNRPQKKNAMSPKLHEEMVGLLSELKYDRDLRVLVITGAGDSMQCEALVEKSMEGRVHILRNVPVPTIAMVNGYCFGGAFSIVAGCDIAIAADEGNFGLSEINFRHFPGGPVSKQISALMRPR